MKPLACCRGGARRGTFRGYTTAQYTGNLGGQVGANQKCSMEFPGSYFCTFADYDLTNPTVAPGGVGAWIDADRAASGARNINECPSSLGAWSTSSSSYYGSNLTSNGSFYTTLACSGMKPLACCQSL
jgi:hypothetical protein